MKLQILVLSGLFCLAAIAQGQTSSQAPQNSKSTASANRVKRAPSTGQTITGCVDQQDGQYVLRDVQSNQLVKLIPTGTDANDDFARFVGHQAQASGTMSDGTFTVTQIGQVSDMCPIGK